MMFLTVLDTAVCTLLKQFMQKLTQTSYMCLLLNYANIISETQTVNAWLGFKHKG